MFLIELLAFFAGNHRCILTDKYVAGNRINQHFHLLDVGVKTLYDGIVVLIGRDGVVHTALSGDLLNNQE